MNGSKTCKKAVALLFTLVLGLGTVTGCHSTQTGKQENKKTDQKEVPVYTVSPKGALPALSYPSEDPMEKAIAKYMVKNFDIYEDEIQIDGARRNPSEEGALVVIPVPMITYVQRPDPAQVAEIDTTDVESMNKDKFKLDYRIYGSYWIFVYCRKGDDLVLVNRVCSPGMFQLEEKAKDKYRVRFFQRVAKSEEEKEEEKSWNSVFAEGVLQQKSLIEDTKKLTDEKEMSVQEKLAQLIERYHRMNRKEQTKQEDAKAQKTNEPEDLKTQKPNE